MKIKNFKNTFFYLLTIGFSIGLLIFFIGCTWIGFEVKNLCQEAKIQYLGGDCTDALIGLLHDESNSFRLRNRAIWALGQLGNPKALPVLESYYTGNIPEREPLNQVISQYELKKAVNLAGGGTNLGAIFWRYGIE
ncbi:MAG: hypothetical protein BWY24_00341 [Microgenomates group bacterium ADurb.Bin219]|nr:MAG: hypothetical protein BWY24_00341 [Microgenomates group bacterium ADurb.Bin219]